MSGLWIVIGNNILELIAMLAIGIVAYRVGAWRTRQKYGVKKDSNIEVIH